MLDIFLQCDLLTQFIHVAVDPHTDIATFFRFFQQLRVRSLSSTYNRCKQLYFGTIRQLHDRIYHLIDRLFFDNFSALRTVYGPNSRV